MAECKWRNKITFLLTSIKVWVFVVATFLLWFDKISQQNWLYITIGVLGGRVFEYYKDVFNGKK